MAASASGTISSFFTKKRAASSPNLSEPTSKRAYVSRTSTTTKLLHEEGTHWEESKLSMNMRAKLQRAGVQAMRVLEMYCSIRKSQAPPATAGQDYDKAVMMVVALEKKVLGLGVGSATSETKRVTERYGGLVEITPKGYVKCRFCGILEKLKDAYGFNKHLRSNSHLVEAHMRWKEGNINPAGAPRPIDKSQYFVNHRKTSRFASSDHNVFCSTNSSVE